MSFSLVATQCAAAFRYPLSQEAVREAYFLGRTTDTRELARFLEQYTRHFPLPDRGPHVAEIEFRTPYEMAVLRSRDHYPWLKYNAQEAETDYAAQPDLIVVSVNIYKTFTFPRFSANPSESEGPNLEGGEAFWRGFRFRVTQQQAIQPNTVSSRIYRRPGLGGAEVLLEFHAPQFASGTARVVVTTPDGQTVEAEFDLGALK